MRRTSASLSISLNWYNLHVRRLLASEEKPLHWVGSSKRDFLGFPERIKDDMGNALGIAQFGGTSPTAKPWKGLGPGVLEVEVTLRYSHGPARRRIGSRTLEDGSEGL